MASNPYIKSLIWLVSFGGIGYGLMLLTEPSKEKIEQIKASAGIDKHQLNADQRKKAIFLEKLQEAASSKTPAYRQTPLSSDKKDN